MYFIWSTVSFVEEEHCRVSICTYLEGSDQMHFGLAESFRDGVKLWLCIHGKLKRMCLLRSLNFTVPVVVIPVCLDLCVVRQGEAGGCWGVAGPCRGAVSLAAACSPCRQKKGISATQLTPLTEQTSPENWTERKKELWLQITKHLSRQTQSAVDFRLFKVLTFLGANAGKTHAVAALMTFYAWKHDYDSI